MKPLVRLAMIVKNEARGIAATLESVRDHVDSWCLLDTGSTDNTQGIAYQVMQGGGWNVPGGVYTEPFVDFSTTRNRALALCAPFYDHASHPDQWILMLSGDMVVERPELLHDIVEAAEAEGCIAVRVRLASVGFTNSHLDLVKAGSGCHFRGIVHEAMNMPEGGKAYDATNSGLVLRYTCNEARDIERWKTDRELLEAELAQYTPEQRVHATRTVFYLAQTYECLGYHARAQALYEERVAMRGLEAERFIAQLRIGRCQWRMLDEHHKIIGSFKAASDMCPERAEPLHEVSRFFLEIDQHENSYFAAVHAAALPLPLNATHFVDADVYEWRAKDQLAVAALNVGRFGECLTHCLELLAGINLPSDQRPRVEMNAAKAKRALAEARAEHREASPP